MTLHVWMCTGMPYELPTVILRALIFWDYNTPVQI